MSAAVADARPRPTTLSAEDREAARVRVLLYALRPDYADPLRPVPPAPTTAAPVTVRDPMAGWGDVPRALGVPAALEALFGGTVAGPTAELFARLRELPPDARAVCVWLRLHAVFTTPRALYVDVGLAFAGSAQLALWGTDLTARRDGSHAHGRRLVCEAAKAWGLPVA